MMRLWQELWQERPFKRFDALGAPTTFFPELKDMPDLPDDDNVTEGLKLWSAGQSIRNVPGSGLVKRRMGEALFRYWPDDEQFVGLSSLYDNPVERARVVGKVLRRMRYYRRERPDPAKLHAEMSELEAMYS